MLAVGGMRELTLHNSALDQLVGMNSGERVWKVEEVADDVTKSVDKR
jgi:hypothetical protein